jgi:circadian clock protein KaiC
MAKDLNIPFPSSIMAGRRKIAKRSPAKQERTPTGIPGFDPLVEGGFKKNSVVTVSGDPGSGKTTFAMQFLYNGAKKYGDVGVFLSLDQSKRALLDDLSRYGWDLAALERKKKLHFITLQPHELDNFQNYELMVRGIIEESGAKRLALDSATSLITAHGSHQAARKELIRMMEKLRGWGVTSVLTSESTTDVHGNMHSPFKIEFLSDAVVYLYNMRQENYRLHALEVVKVRGTSINSKMCPLKFGKQGLEVFPNQTVFK